MNSEILSTIYRQLVVWWLITELLAKKNKEKKNQTSDLCKSSINQAHLLP